jgi:preprotein translocase subunit SecY
MLEKLANIFKIPDLRTRVLFTLGLLAVYRLGAHIPTPGIDAKQLAAFFNQNAGSALGLVDLCAGHHAIHHRLDHLPAADRDL